MHRHLGVLLTLLFLTLLKCTLARKCSIYGLCSNDKSKYAVVNMKPVDHSKNVEFVNLFNKTCPDTYAKYRVKNIYCHILVKMNHHALQNWLRVNSFEKRQNNRVLCKIYNRLYKIHKYDLARDVRSKTDSETLYINIKAFFESININISKCFAIGTDGASNLRGIRNSLYTKIRQDNPNLILIKCPDDINFIICETFNFFKSHLRFRQYKNLYMIINDERSPLRFIPINKTRWLVRTSVIKILTDQWDVLKTYLCLNITDERSSCAENLLNLFNNTNYLYFIFLNPIVRAFENINKNFQSDKCDPSRLLDEIIIDIFIDPEDPTNSKSLDQMDIGSLPRQLIGAHIEINTNVLVTMRYFLLGNTKKHRFSNDTPPLPKFLKISHDFTDQILEAFISADIPLYKLINPKIKALFNDIIINRAKAAVNQLGLDNALIQICTYLYLLDVIEMDQESSFSIEKAYNVLCNLSFDSDTCNINDYINKRLTKNDIYAIMNNLDSNKSSILYHSLRNAPFTFVSVERNFSLSKKMVTKQRPLAPENIQKYIILYHKNKYSINYPFA
ncbi:hypothetical protein A3Q56_06773 [Intoshia linei]|uniref:HAT C-terminal dimerisation domain-containing protein n=1 Tax=Intoshia linei TaxID=1819745 RepID=A0A177AW99_9BILA|nr:hypothetical protein A3Q56_06773 [Intoshia linei]